MEVDTEKEVTITVPNAFNLSQDLADLLCWWQGFKAGRKLENDCADSFEAENGVNAARKINILLKKELNLS